MALAALAANHRLTEKQTPLAWAMGIAMLPFPQRSFSCVISPQLNE
jgi:hypothetical protein